MKYLHCILLIFVIAVSLLSCASGPPSYEQNIQSAISGRGFVNISYLASGVVLLTGELEDTYTLNAVKRAAMNNNNVKRVISRIYLTN